MARKGVATVTTATRRDGHQHASLAPDHQEPSSAAHASRHSRSPAANDSRVHERPWLGHELDSVDRATSREALNLSKAAQSGPEPAPRQASGAVGQGRPLALESALFPDRVHTQLLLPRAEASRQHHAPEPVASLPRYHANHDPPAHEPYLSAAAARRPRRPHPTPTKPSANPAPDANDPDELANMAGGAYIPPNQQRNMRACMVCSIVRTQQQFMTQGCPNCEDILELTGNPEQINDCTSQVFEGLITVADTSKSWVARYQRLEGYQPGVYATQVEGILPDDIIGLIESAGINYVPRDGSEQDMLPKD
ncbi:transcription elongation factor spt4 [Exserohilum turcicum]